MSATVAARNAANAQNSTGPVTAEGKARSAQNALRHGLTSRAVVLPHESQEEYERLKSSFFATHRPATDLESELVARIVDCWWRLARALRVETEFLAQRAEAVSEATPEVAGDAALAAMFDDAAQSKSYRLFLRYLTNAQNAYRQACAEFRQVRKERLAEEADANSLEALFAGKQPPANITSGFVSHEADSAPVIPGAGNPGSPGSLADLRAAA